MEVQENDYNSPQILTLANYTTNEIYKSTGINGNSYIFDDKVLSQKFQESFDNGSFPSLMLYSSDQLEKANNIERTVLDNLSSPVKIKIYYTEFEQ